MLKIKSECRKQPNPAQQQQHHQRLDQLFVRYLFQPFCEEQQPHQPLEQVLAPLHSPAYRCQQLRQLPLQLGHLQYRARHGEDLITICEQLPLNKHSRHQLALQANQAPFAGNHALIKDFDDIAQHIERQSSLMLITSGLIKQLCMDENDPLEQVLFQHGIYHAHIASQMPEHAPHSAFSAFLMACCRLLSLTLLGRLLKQQHLSKKQLNNHLIPQLLPRLDYWLAKDLGLNQAMLDSLRQRLSQPPGNQIHWLDKAEHAALAFLLYQHQQFTAKQLQQFLQAIQLTDLQLPSQLINTTH